MSKKQTFKCDWYGKEFEEYASNRRNDKNFAPYHAMVYTKGGYRSLNVIIVGLSLKETLPKNTEKRTIVLGNVTLQEDIFQAIIHIPVPHVGKSLEDMPPRFTLRMYIALKSVSVSY